MLGCHPSCAAFDPLAAWLGDVSCRAYILAAAPPKHLLFVVSDAPAQRLHACLRCLHMQTPSVLSPSMRAPLLVRQAACSKLAA